MKVIKAGYEIYPLANSFSMITRIEEIARVCYKSEDKITAGSAKKMVRALTKNKHHAMLEHGNIVMKADREAYGAITDTLKEIRKCEGGVPKLRYTAKQYSEAGRYIVSGNMRAWLEFVDLCNKHELPLNASLVDVLKNPKYSPIFDEVDVSYTKKRGVFTELEYEALTDKEKWVHMSISVKFIVDRGVSHEIVRHREASFAQESTRYCNYSGDVVFIEPCFFEPDTVVYRAWAESMKFAENIYCTLLANGRTPQEARDVLPNSTKTEVVMTATPRIWDHFFNLRARGVTGAPHPQMKEVAVPLMDEMLYKFPCFYEVTRV